MDEINIEMEINIESLEEFLFNDLPRILAQNAVSFENSAFVLQASINALKELEGKET